jgi:hypothetical protein
VTKNTKYAKRAVNPRAADRPVRGVWPPEGRIVINPLAASQSPLIQRLPDDGLHLQKDTPLEMLKLSGNKLRDDSGFHLANALLKNHHLRM